MFDMDLDNYMHYVVYFEFCDGSGKTKHEYMEDGFTDDYFSIEEWYDWVVENEGFYAEIDESERKKYEEINIVIYYYDAIEYENNDDSFCTILKIDKLNLLDVDINDEKYNN